MSHGPHEALSGYHPAHLFHDGCEECETRITIGAGIGSMDPHRFAAAWSRATLYGQDQPVPGGVSKTELPALRALWAVQVQLEQRGIPITGIPPSPRRLP